MSSRLTKMTNVFIISPANSDNNKFAWFVRLLRNMFMTADFSYLELSDLTPQWEISRNLDVDYDS